MAAIQAGIARGRADAAAGRVIDADTLEAELRAEFAMDADVIDVRQDIPNPRL
ncbi:hypothetical protein [Niveispirillum sp. KHB5.9]|uniref:hypothetical protein n=1 Tax=Niveispirillum sp. KHB5.9 TaxID=3400269 RepID=UPI003A859596